MASTSNLDRVIKQTRRVDKISPVIDQKLGFSVREGIMVESIDRQNTWSRDASMSGLRIEARRTGDVIEEASKPKAKELDSKRSEQSLAWWNGRGLEVWIIKIAKRPEVRSTY